MSRRNNSTPAMPAAPFGLLLVEGGDERTLCDAVVGPTTWTGLWCWNAEGRTNLKNIARLARLDPNFGYARSVGLLLDIENDPKEALRIAADVLQVFGGNVPPVHGVMTGESLSTGVFLAPDGQSLGSIELLCRQAIREPKVAACVDTLVTCAQTSHPTQALAAKGWLQAYFAMFPEPHRFHDAFDTKKGGSIDPTHHVFDSLRNFLRSL